MKKADIDTQLARVYNERYFTDGDGRRVWAGAEPRMHRKRSPLRWAVPLAAAAMVLLTLCVIPQARAAVVKFFNRAMSIFDYVGMEEDDRPTDTTLEGLVQGNISSVVTVTALPGGEWLKKIGFSIKDVLYDGRYVYIKYTMDSNGTENFHVEPVIKEGQTVYFKDYSHETLVLDGSGELYCREIQPIFKLVQIENGRVYYDIFQDNGTATEVVQFDANGMRLSGSISGVLTIYFWNYTNTMKDGVETGTHEAAGIIKAEFSFDASGDPKHIR